MARTAYVATLQLLVLAKDEAEASDGISESLLAWEDNGFLVDWGYLRVGGQLLSPSEKTIADADEYEEGDFLS